MADDPTKILMPVFSRWWNAITDARNQGRNADRAALAQLRRLKLNDFGEGPRPDVALAMTLDAFRDLYLKVSRAGARLPPDWESDLVVAAVTLAHVRSDAPGQSTAGMLGGRDADQRKMKEARFLRLMRVSTAADLFNQTRRLTALADGKAPVGDLGASLLFWRSQPNVRRDWARAYYGLDRPSSEYPDQPAAPAGA